MKGVSVGTNTEDDEKDDKKKLMDDFIEDIKDLRGVLGQSRCGTGNFGSRPQAVENVEFVDEDDGSSASRPSNLIVHGSFDLLSFALITTEAPDNEPPDDVAFDAAKTPASDTLPKPRVRRDILSHGSRRGSLSMAWGGSSCERKHATIYIAIECTHHSATQ
eukprot:scaffold38778_cov41-Cyclotella_meneghiniana.AAC.2